MVVVVGKRGEAGVWPLGRQWLPCAMVHMEKSLSLGGSMAGGSVPCAFLEFEFERVPYLPRRSTYVD